MSEDINLAIHRILSTDQDIGTVNEMLRAISSTVLPEGLVLQVANPRDLQPQHINARFMDDGTFNQLIANARRVQALESVPLCVRMGTSEIDIISGHHRIRAAVEAGIQRVLILLYERDMTRSEIVAKQLAHNNLVGDDREDVLATLVREIQDYGDLVQEAHLDLSDYAPPSEDTSAADNTAQEIEADINTTEAVKTVLLLFVPSQYDHVDAYVRAVTTNQPIDTALLAARETFEPWVSALQAVSAATRIEVVPQAVAEMARIASEAHAVGVVQPTQPGGWVPLVSLFGGSTAAVPPEVANVIRQAIAKLQQSGDVSADAPWQALEYMAAEILNE